MLLPRALVPLSLQASGYKSSSIPPAYPSPSPALLLPTTASSASVVLGPTPTTFRLPAPTGPSFPGNVGDMSYAQVLGKNLAERGAPGEYGSSNLRKVLLGTDPLFTFSGTDWVTTTQYVDVKNYVPQYTTIFTTWGVVESGVVDAGTTTISIYAGGERFLFFQMRGKVRLKELTLPNFSIFTGPQTTFTLTPVLVTYYPITTIYYTSSITVTHGITITATQVTQVSTNYVTTSPTQVFTNSAQTTPTGTSSTQPTPTPTPSPRGPSQFQTCLAGDSNPFNEPYQLTPDQTRTLCEFKLSEGGVFGTEG